MGMRRVGFLTFLTLLLAAFVLSSCSSKKPTESADPLGQNDTTSHADTATQSGDTTTPPDTAAQSGDTTITPPDTANQVDSTGATADTVVNWVGTDVLYNQSLQKHDQSLLFIMVSWCIHCQHLKQNTLTDSNVIAVINSGFNASKIDADSLEMVAYGDSMVTEHEMAHGIYQITGYPTIIVLNSEGVETQRMVGERGPEQFVNELNQILSTH